MNKRWNLEELREYVRNSKDSARMLNVIRSIDRSNAIFNYHVFTALNALDSIVGDSDSTDIEMMKYVFCIHEKQEEKTKADLVSEASIISSIYTIRAIYDMFSHLVNGLVLAGKFTERECNLKKVVKNLSHSTLQSKLDFLLDSSWFKYVDGFVNTTKHRNLVSHSFTVCFQENKVGAKIAGFTYENVAHQSYWARELLEGIVSVKNDLIACGNSLNDHCLRRVA
ncbi:hypothetical protein [Nitrosococcus wardiae]|uniref:Cthe-2314-like HEPN domain-containing protein n=1 Tax=Nitrosococcus wardiae TaxID=1814290 RepID=A0A4P7BU07_9GAMM|nr:hypothetical protein [Nitrosococcus wardiae]QBQ53383.1 hypothetical protein E3U44_01825 [Nitrosococcus wardiae]